MKQLGQKLAALLESHGMTQTDLAERAGWSQAKVHRLLSGKNRGDKHDLADLAQAFPSSDDQRALAIAHISDEIPEVTLGGLKISGGATTRPVQWKFAPLGEETARAIKHLADVGVLPQLEQVIQSLAKSFGWRAK